MSEEQLPRAQPPGAREALSRERIIAAATDVINAEGLPALTMRRLGQRLEVQAMSLYYYIPSRRHLLDAVADSAAEELYRGGTHSHPPGGWQDHLRQTASALRSIACAHPALFRLMATHPPAAAWLRPPLRSLAGLELFLSTLLAGGFSGEQAVIAYRAYSRFLLGHLLLEVAQRGASVPAVDNPSATTDPGPAALRRDFPMLDVRSPLSLDERAIQFQAALESLIARLGSMLPSDASSS